MGEWKSKGLWAGEALDSSGILGSLPLAVQWLGLTERNHGCLLRESAQGLGVAGSSRGAPFGGRQRVVGGRPAPLPGSIAAVGGPAPGGGGLRLCLGF